MPNTHVPAAGEAMPAVEGMQIVTGRFSRRFMLLGAAAAVPAIAGGVAASATPPAKAVDPLERFQAALAEFQAAAEALDPRIYDWTVKTNGHLSCGIAIAAFRMTTKYEGDGWYRSPDANEEKVFVEHVPERDRNGTRCLRVTSWWRGRKAYAFTPESAFNKIYGTKL